MKIHFSLIPLVVVVASLVAVGIYAKRKEIVLKRSDVPFPLAVEKGQEVATFAGGCFWCMEPSYQESDGIINAVVGYAGGQESDASYKEVAQGKTKHREAVQVIFDPTKISYNKLLNIYWRQIDPTDEGGQFTDRGFQYTTAIFYHNDNQKHLAEKSKKSLSDSNKFEEAIVTEVVPYTTFFLAEEYHQDYYMKAKDHYERYKKGSGRADFIEENWARDAALEAAEEDSRESYNYTQEEIDEMLKDLDPLAYHVVAEGGTETPFNNPYWDNKADGIYVDIVTKKPLFSSTHKYDSGTGWPSFWRTIDDNSITLHEDNSLSINRTEIRSDGGHVGHVFDDGPKEEGGNRFCTNSSSLLFIAKEDMSKEGYNDYLYLFE